MVAHAPVFFDEVLHGLVIEGLILDAAQRLDLAQALEQFLVDVEAHQALAVTGSLFGLAGRLGGGRLHGWGRAPLRGVGGPGIRILDLFNGLV